MKFKLALTALIIAPLMLGACTKKNDAPVSQSQESEVASSNEKVTAEQQAAIDALDQPIMDEKNTDVPESVANASAESSVSTEHSEE